MNKENNKKKTKWKPLRWWIVLTIFIVVGIIVINASIGSSSTEDGVRLARGPPIIFMLLITVYCLFTDRSAPQTIGKRLLYIIGLSICAWLLHAVITLPSVLLVGFTFGEEMNEIALEGTTSLIAAIPVVILAMRRSRIFTSGPNGNIAKSLRGTIKIKFKNEREAFIEYKAINRSEKEIQGDMAELFLFYYAKILYNLSEGELADKLILKIQKIVSGSLDEKKGNKKLKALTSTEKLLTTKPENISKLYTGELHVKNNRMFPQTHNSLGGEKHYAPLSVLMFLQYLIENLPANDRKFLMLCVSGMHRYYQEEKNYWDMQSICDAPIYSLGLVAKILNKNNQ